MLGWSSGLWEVRVIKHFLHLHQHADSLLTKTGQHVLLMGVHLLHFLQAGVSEFGADGHSGHDFVQ